MHAQHITAGPSGLNSNAAGPSGLNSNAATIPLASLMAGTPGMGWGVYPTPFNQWYPSQ